MKIVYYTMLLASVLNCNGQIKKPNKMNANLSSEEIEKQGYKAKENDTIMMIDGKLDIKTLEKEGIPVSSSVLSDDGWKNVDSYEYTEESSNNYVFISGNKITGYYKKIKKGNDYFETTYVYYPNGNLKLKNILFLPEYFKKGIWYWYDENGVIEKYEDFDKPYGYTWEDILNFMKEQDIKREDTYNVSREVKNDKPYWYISQVTKRGLEPEEVKEYTLDGNTGKIIKTEMIDVTRHLD